MCTTNNLEASHNWQRYYGALFLGTGIVSPAENSPTTQTKRTWRLFKKFRYLHLYRNTLQKSHSDMWWNVQLFKSRLRSLVQECFRLRIYFPETNRLLIHYPKICRPLWRFVSNCFTGHIVLWGCRKGNGRKRVYRQFLYLKIEPRI